MPTHHRPRPSGTSARADTHEAQVCHLSERGSTLAACGAPLTTAGHGEWRGERTCAKHDRPYCAACLQIADVYHFTGAWEGP